MTDIDDLLNDGGKKAGGVQPNTQEHPNFGRGRHRVHG